MKSRSLVWSVGMILLSVMTHVGAQTDVLVRLTAQSSISASTSGSSVPASLGSVKVGDTYYIEVWLTDQASVAPGVTVSVVDVTYTSGLATIENVQGDCGVFTLFGQGTAYDGIVDELGAGSLTTRGTAPEWVKAGCIEARASTAGNITWALGASTAGIRGGSSRGLIPWSRISLGSLTIAHSIDSDGDGVVDSEDGCPSDGSKTAPGQCGCGVSDTDSDGDGVANCIDGCPGDPAKHSPGSCGCGNPDIDTDGDTVPDCIDDCSGTASGEPVNAHGCPFGDDCNDNGVDDETDITTGTSTDCNNNNVPDECETDSDGDGHIDSCDDCPNDAGKTSPGQCGCGTADTDSDSDTVADCLDDCPGTPAGEPVDVDGCEFPDDCNGNGINDAADVAAGTSTDCNNNNVPDECETDSDGDGAIDRCDQCPNNEAKVVPGICGCDDTDDDWDGDGVPACNDACLDTPDDTPVDPDGCPAPDCNNNKVWDPDDIALGTSADCNGNSIPDECEDDTGCSGGGGGSTAPACGLAGMIILAFMGASAMLIGRKR